MTAVENTNPTLQLFGSAGNSLGANTVVTSLAVATPGVYRIWGSVRHTLIDGCKLVTPVALQLTSAANDTAVFGPLVAPILTPSNIVIQLATATGVADTASATIFAQRVS